MGAIFTLRWKAPLMALGGPSIDRYTQVLPIPARAMVTGMLGAALGLRRAEAERLQLLQDTLRHAVVVQRAGTPLEDYQTADLSQAHLRGPMWWRDARGRVGVIERQGGDTEGIRPLHRPYLADADMTVLVELLAGAPYAAETLVQQ
jgi:CRISPR-associated protein Cas5/CasD subtype I-E